MRPSREKLAAIRRLVAESAPNPGHEEFHAFFLGEAIGSEELAEWVMDLLAENDALTIERNLLPEVSP